MEPPCYVWLHASYSYGSTIKCIEDLWSHRAVFGSMHCTPMGRPSEVGGGNGAERRPPPGIQAQRPSPSHRTHRTHDTTDQWRDRFWWLGRFLRFCCVLRVMHASNVQKSVSCPQMPVPIVLLMERSGFIEATSRTKQ